MNSKPLREFLNGLKGATPLLFGVIPFGLIYGVLAVAAGLPSSMAQGMSLIVFAGSAQFITTQLIHEQAPLLVIIATAAVVNLRHLLYSASMAPYLHHLPYRWKALLAYVLTDEAYAITIARYLDTDDAPTASKHWYFFGAGAALWLSWQISTAVGIFLGAQVPDSWALDFSLPLTFIALVVPAVKDRASIAAALAAGTVVLLTLGMPLKLGLVTAIITGIVVGYGSERMRAPRGFPQDERMTR